MVTVAKVSYVHEADLICMRLEEVGINTFVADQYLASAQPLYSGAIGGIRIQVHEDDLDKAQKVLLKDGSAREL